MAVAGSESVKPIISASLSAADSNILSEKFLYLAKPTNKANSDILMINSTFDISRKILFVDDESLLLEGIKRQLRREFALSFAESGDAALELLASLGPFAVVVSDFNMPGMDGIAFLSAVNRLYPQTVLIMLTGRAELDVAVKALHNAHISRFLNKPCPKEILIETLRDGLEQYRLRVSEQLLQDQLREANQQLCQFNHHLEALVEQKTRSLQLQYRYATRMTQVSHSSEIAEALAGNVVELTSVQDITLWLSPKLDDQFACHYPPNASWPVFQGKNCPEGIIACLLSSKQPWWRNNDVIQAISTFDRSLFRGEPLLSIPLLSKQGILGLLNLAGSEIELTNDVLDALAGMADVTATALQSYWHREAHDEAQDAIITALAKLSEYRDPETGAHLLRLKKYCALICCYLENTDRYRDLITPKFTQDLVRSSPLHDIGKVGIPDAILKKPGKLTPDEFEIMKTHALIGGDTLRVLYEKYPSQSFIRCGMDIAYCHHEKWNGSGYPYGLQGESIPLAARILALVDVYDALTCRRVYKEPFSHEQAKSLIIEGSGIHFDPDIVAAFLGNEADFYQIAQQFSDST
ncbi:HD domain-containing phosphohydrolase [Methylomicrobium sp. RS1]|uniref:HD domain-containing phosphohydrolase n=1 Tax=Candidatus Methylomicrobium oryzae TaxID=2802053 RepID=UPI0019211525|nr:HD domain-containing phosphohydrolase [Methylomicrobium sp. RS1]MBL1265240.1 response regulator [Methylomicrobium sp. RS1]